MTMMLEQLREQMASYRRSANEQASALKDAHHALERLRALYLRFDADERALADEVITEWASSDDENLRFDALTLIDEFRITRAAGALSTLAARLAGSAAPGAPFELRKVQRIVETLRG